MCCRYYFDDISYRKVQEIAVPVDSEMRQRSWNRDILPTDYAPVMTATVTGKQLNLFRFGYRNEKNNSLVINARSETADQKPMFRDGLMYHRAVIPARHFYEWNALKEKSEFSRTDAGILYFAGIWDAHDSFVILTTAANVSMEKIHDRMPLILEENQLDDWLFNPQATQGILQQMPVLLDRKTEYEQLTFL